MAGLRVPYGFPLDGIATGICYGIRVKELLCWLIRASLRESLDRSCREETPETHTP
jgi:hypothetical protein